MVNKKYLKTIVSGVIFKLIILDETYINVERLYDAIDMHCKTNCNFPLNNNITKERVDKILLGLFMSRRILPDVVNGNGYIISLNCEEAIESANELFERTLSITSPKMVCLPIALYSLDDAIINLNKLDRETKQVINNITNYYVESYLNFEDATLEYSK